MKSKLNYLIGVSLKRKINNKWFKIANLILGIVIVGIINVDSIITFFGGDFNDKMNLYVIDDVNSVEIFKNQIETTDKSIYGEDSNNYNIESYSGTEEEIKELLNKDDNNIVIKLQEDQNNIFKVEIMSKSKIDTIEYQVITNALTNTKVSLAITALNMTQEEINALYKTPEITRTILDESDNVDENQELIMTTVFPIVILPFFMLTIFLVQMIGAEVNDEKTTRGMEIIISNVSPKTHFFSKAIAGNIFVLLQGGLLFLFAGVGLLVRKMVGGGAIANGVGSEIGGFVNQILESSIGESLLYIIPLTLVLMILTFVAYSLLAGVLASVTTNQEDFQHLQTPIIITLLLGYYLSILAGVFKGAIFIKILAFVPFISAILAPSLLVMGQMGIIEILIAIALMIGTIYLLVKYGLKVYKVGILNYSSTDLWKKMFKAMKEKE